MRMILKVMVVVTVMLCANQNVWAATPEANDGNAANALTPRCSADEDCRKNGLDLRPICQNPGEITASCFYQEVSKISCLIVVPEKCRTCNLEAIVNNLKSLFPGLAVEYLNGNQPRAKKLIDDFNIEMLPAIFLSRDIEKNPNFSRIARLVKSAQDQYYLQPAFTGVSYFVGRPKEKDKLDAFLLLTHQDTFPVLRLLKEVTAKKKEIQLRLHLVGRKDIESGEILSPRGIREIDEDKLYLCVENLYSEKTWDYLFCRTGQVDSLWWEDCVKKNDMDAEKVRQCARSEESAKWLEERIKLSKELNITYAPLFLLENIEIFGPSAQTMPQELIGIIESK